MCFCGSKIDRKSIELTLDSAMTVTVGIYSVGSGSVAMYLDTLGNQVLFQ